MSDESPGNRDVKILKRKKLVRDVANTLCRHFSKEVKERFGVDSAFSYNENAPENDYILNRYFDYIDKFKKECQMTNGELANKCKRAAAWALVSEDQATLRRLFNIKTFTHSETYSKIFMARFTYEMCCTLLRVDQSKISADVERNFIHILLKARGEASFPWLVWGMRSFAEAYGAADAQPKLQDATEPSASTP